MLLQNRGMVASLWVARMVTGNMLNMVITMTPFSGLNLN